MRVVAEKRRNYYEDEAKKLTFESAHSFVKLKKKEYCTKLLNKYINSSEVRK